MQTKPIRTLKTIKKIKPSRNKNIFILKNLKLKQQFKVLNELNRIYPEIV